MLNGQGNMAGPFDLAPPLPHDAVLVAGAEADISQARLRFALGPTRWSRRCTSERV